MFGVIEDTSGILFVQNQRVVGGREVLTWDFTERLTGLDPTARREELAIEVGDEPFWAAGFWVTGVTAGGVRAIAPGMNFATIGTQVLLSFMCDSNEPVRFGFPLPVAAVARGLRITKPGALFQWRPLQDRPDPVTGRLWVELAITGVHGRVAIAAGGSGPVSESGGVACTVDIDAQDDEVVEVRRQTWRWTTGEIDWRERRTFRVETEVDGEVYGAGETLTTESSDLAARWLRVGITGKKWARAGVLPQLGRVARPFREHLAQAAQALVQLPGRRGRGDYARSGAVVTNLEFDTTLGLARLGLALERRALLQRAADSARHLVDRDMDRGKGLPFCHGLDHRVAAPEPGHVWLSGVLLVGCLSADEDLIRAARSMAHGLARHPAQGEGRDERLRDRGWPLLEMEAYLRFEHRKSIERAADRLAADLVQRWDPRNRVLRFGEGERRGGVYEERSWLIGGIAVPALRAHMLRRPSAQVAGIVGELERRLMGLVLEGRPGLPIRYWAVDGRVTSQVRLSQVPEGYLLLEGLAPRNLARCLGRKAVSRALGGVPAVDHPDLATHWSMAARCSWIFR